MDSRAFEQLVGATYGCVFQPEGWRAVLDRIQHETGAHSSYLLIHDTDPRRPEMATIVDNNVDAKMRRLCDQHYVGLNPQAARIAA